MIRPWAKPMLVWVMFKNKLLCPDDKNDFSTYDLKQLNERNNQRNRVLKLRLNKTSGTSSIESVYSLAIDCRQILILELIANMQQCHKHVKM